jgi:hypothetical protein
MVVTQVGGHGGLSLAVEGHVLSRGDLAMPSRTLVAATEESSATMPMTDRLMDLHREMIADLIGNLRAAIGLTMTGKKISSLIGNLQVARGTMIGMMTTGAVAGMTIGSLIGQNQERGSKEPVSGSFFLLYSPVLLYMQ